MISMFFRSITTTALFRQSRRGVVPLKRAKNPGIEKRYRAMEENIELSQGEVDLEDLEDAEADLSRMGEAYDSHEEETGQQRELLRHRIVRQKYFSVQMPNLLMWSEKEHIRQLHQGDPEDWTPEKIADSFPVTEAVAKKILKMDWKPANINRIKRHDESAMRNWKQLREGTLEDFPEKLRQHFLTFSNRSIPPTNEGIQLTQNTGYKSKFNEYSQIISSYEKKIGLVSDNNTVVKKALEPSSTNKLALTKDALTSERYIEQEYMPETDNTKNHFITLDRLQSSIIYKAKENISNVSPLDKLIISSEPDPKEVSYSTKFSNQEIDTYPDEKKHLPNKFNEAPIDETRKVPTYLEKIKIPLKVWKKGGTYKVDDCYYDDDGKFLYRVLGMSGNNNSNSK